MLPIFGLSFSLFISLHRRMLMTHSRIVAFTILAASFAAQTFAAVTGQWDFDNSANPLAATTGVPIEYFDGPGGATETLTHVGTTTSFGIPDINGSPASVMKFGVNTATMGYAVAHGVPANGEGSFANQYSIIMDVLFPASSTGKWRALVQTDPTNPSDDDAEWYIDESNGLGILGVYNGVVPASTWVRLGIVVDLAAETPGFSKYINGVKVGHQDGALDSRFALMPDAFFLLFTDGYEGGIYTEPGYINSLQVQDVALSDAYMAALGGPSAAGIPSTVQTHAFVRSTTPVSGGNAAPETSYTAEIENALTKVNTSSIHLTLNGSPVTPTIQAAGDITTVTYTNSTLFPAKSTNTWQLVFNDDGTPSTSVTNTVEIVVANYTAPKVVATWQFNGDITGSGAATLAYASPETQSAVSFKTTDGTTVANIGGQPAGYIDIPPLPEGKHGLSLTADTQPSGGQYVNQYSMVWDVYVPNDIYWLPFFNTNPDAGNDADFYISDVGALGIGDLGYSLDGVIQPNTWYRVAFTADLVKGEVTYYLNGTSVYQRTGDPLTDGRFSLYSSIDPGPDVLLFSEPSGVSTHEVYVNSFLFTDQILSADQVAALGGPTANGISLVATARPHLSITRNGNQVTISWSGGDGPFQVQKATTLTNPNWQPVTTPAGATSVTETTSGQAAFYRVLDQ
jgi:hypothetical protein